MGEPKDSTEAKPPCPFCGRQSSRVLDVWYRQRDDARRRRLECHHCGWRFSTTERADERHITTCGVDERSTRA